MKRLFLLLLVALLCLTMAVTAQENGETLVIAAGNDPTTFNPVYQVEAIGEAATRLVWDTLYVFDPFTGEPMPRMATWTTSEDGLTITMTLGEDIMWSDGTPVTSADARFTFDALRSDIAASPIKGLVSAVDHVDIVDDKTFNVVLSAVDCGIWGTMWRAVPMPAHLYAADFSDLQTNENNLRPSVSSGPYLFDDRQADEFVRFVANPGYWQGAPNIDTLVFRIIPDAAARMQSLSSGESHWSTVTADQLDQITNIDSFNVYRYPQAMLFVVAMNWADPANPQPALDADGSYIAQDPNPFFADTRVRRAVAMGWDRGALLSTLGEGNAALLSGPILPQLEWAYDPSIEPYPYDPEAAAALLDEAGWTDEDGDGVRECHGCMHAEEGTPFSLELDYTAVNSIFENTALIMQDQLSALGIDIQLNAMEAGALISEALLPQTFDMLLINFAPGSPSASAVPSIYMISQVDIPGAGPDFVSYSNPAFDALVQQAQSMPGCSTEALAPLYAEIQRIAYEDVAIDFTVSPNSIQVMSTRVSGFDPGPWDAIGNIIEWTLEG